MAQAAAHSLQCDEAALCALSSHSAALRRIRLVPWQKKHAFLNLGAQAN